MKKIRMTLLAFALVATLVSCSKNDDSNPQPDNQSIAIDLTLPGTLSTSLSIAQRSTITSLTLKGSIDARDFKTLRDSMPVLAKLDLSKATIVAYTGTNGTIEMLYTYNGNTIPYLAFWGTQANPMIIIDLPGVTGTPAPAGKESLTSVVFPSNLKEIGEGAFSSCKGLTGDLIIPESVTKIGRSAFSNCKGITKLTLPSSLKIIDAHAFLACSGITGSLIIPPTIEEINDFAFGLCSGFTGELNIPASLEVINAALFYGCSGLTSVIIPASVTTISQEAFSGCTGLNSIKVFGSQPATITGDRFGPFSNMNTSTCVLKVPTGSKSAYSNANQWSEFANIVEY